MILQHPRTLDKIVISQRSYIRIQQLKQEGYVDITPPRTGRQLEVTRKFIAAGQFMRTRANITQCIKMGYHSLSDSERIKLQEASAILYSLFKRLDQD